MNTVTTTRLDALRERVTKSKMASHSAWQLSQTRQTTSVDDFTRKDGFHRQLVTATSGNA